LKYLQARVSAQQLTHGNDLFRDLNQLLLAAHGLASHQGVGLFFAAFCKVVVASAVFLSG
jgi:hypothetical protein